MKFLSSKSFTCLVRVTQDIAYYLRLLWCVLFPWFFPAYLSFVYGRDTDVYEFSLYPATLQFSSCSIHRIMQWNFSWQIRRLTQQKYTFWWRLAQMQCSENSAFLIVAAPAVNLLWSLSALCHNSSKLRECWPLCFSYLLHWSITNF